ncbi:TlpA disulfide reductase family protein [uncultured Polaribacter sp.]|uniref:TlpA family protein disulfide reductase n=1 Tax=uncultured Polaribacter sp. TaxID=174711 RepID=UPI00261AAC0A|nr:TlpA disulfide reductase family protein [uncultured Polaribacter sp.]
MKNIVFTVVLLILIFSCTEKVTKENKTVTLTGTIANYDQDTLYMNNISSKFMLFKEDIQGIPLEGRNNFNYKFELEKPTYFQIGRTFLYLSPGDSLVANLDTKSRSLAKFEGRGAEANNYLTNVPYPKGGSYWGDREIALKIETYQEIPEAFKKSVDHRLEELNKLNSVSDEFKMLEKARTKFDYVNSMNNLFYLYYAKVRKGEMKQETMDTKIEEASNYLIPYKQSLLDDFNKKEYLQLEVFQSVLYSLSDDDFTSKHQLVELDATLKEYVRTRDLLNELKFNGYSNEIGDKLKIASQNITTKNYATVLQDVQKEYETITKGNPASDLIFTTLKNGNVALSDYKGKVIVLDLWATWCGPCMKEKPFFEALEKKYHGNENIEFISLSIDTEKVWREYFEENDIVGNQLQINRSQLTNYKVAGIPRFFVIDKNFKIVDVFAPLPSSGDLEKLMNQYI